MAGLIEAVQVDDLMDTKQNKKKKKKYINENKNKKVKRKEENKKSRNRLNNARGKVSFNDVEESPERIHRTRKNPGNNSERIRRASFVSTLKRILITWIVSHFIRLVSRPPFPNRLKSSGQLRTNESILSIWMAEEWPKMERGGGNEGTVDQKSAHGGNKHDRITRHWLLCESN